MELLNRGAELAALNDLLEAAAAGRGGALVLRGDWGVGLSALLEAAIQAAGPMRVARIRGVRAERELDFAAAHQLCASLLDQLEALPQPHRDVLASAFGQSDGDLVGRFQVGLALFTLLSTAAEEQPLLCVIDDAQWLDVASAEPLAFVARRLDRQRIALVVAVHEPAVGGALFAGVDELEVRGLPPDAASKVLGSVVAGPLDGRVRDRLLAEAAGNPLALVQLPAQLTPEQLAGLAGLPEILSVDERLQARFRAAISDMPAETRTLLLLAAAEADGTADLLWRAAASLGLSAEAGAPAEAAGVLRVGRRIAFGHPLTRPAIYGSATVAERRRVHQALADALDPDADPERRAWHRAAASLAPDEDVAAELEAAAARQKGSRDDAAAAALLERAAELTPDARRRYRRTLAAAQAALAAGALARAASLLDRAAPEPLDELERAQTARLRGVVGLALGRGADRATMLVRAARALEPVDARLARDSHLEALEAAIYTRRPGNDRSLRDTAEAAGSAPEPPASRTGAADLLLDGLALLVTAGHAAAAPTIRHAIESLRDADEPRWLALGALAAIELWDDEGLHELATRQTELTGGGHARPTMPFALSQLGDMDAVVTGRFGTTTAPFAEQRELTEAVGHRLSAPPLTPAELLASAWRGRSTEARDLAEASMREAFARELGLHVAVAHLAIAILELGLGRYEAALSAARTVCAEDGLFAVSAALPELIEAAVRAGERELAVSAVAQLAERAAPSGTRWALGTLARCRALLEEGDEAETLYREAIEHLRSSRAAPQLARAHLLYGEWLRRERRRREAREELRTARDMFIFMGAQAFAERARVELTATGEHARRAEGDDPAELLTAQEAQIARLVSDGATNAAIAAQLFISPRTVEYHLHKTFRKLGVSSRTQLARLMLRSDDAAGTP